MKRLPRRSRVMTVGLVLAAAIPVIMGSTHALSASTAANATKQIAVSTLENDFRVTLTTIQGPGEGGAPSATVQVAAFKRSGSDWHKIGQQTVGDANGWFWNVVASPGGICRFSTSDVGPYPIEVRLLVSDSIGCSPATYNFHVDRYGALVSG